MCKELFNWPLPSEHFSSMTQLPKWEGYPAKKKTIKKPAKLQGLIGEIIFASFWPIYNL